MAFNGSWKVDRSENYDKFMEQMGECVRELVYEDKVYNCVPMWFDIAVWMFHSALMCLWH